MRPFTYLCALALVAPAALAVPRQPGQPGQPVAAGRGWSGAVDRRTVRGPRVGPRFDPAVIRESSGLAASVRAPGLLWTVNDGGSAPELFAVAAGDGRVLGRVRVAGARNVDWEALALGPCGAPAACLYVGDVGDNAAARASVTLYRTPEPLGTLAGPPPRRGAAGLPAATGPVASLEVRYADGPRDVEAMAVLPDGGVWLITKHPLRRPDGTARPALVYRVEAAAWDAGGAATARLVDSLPVVPDETVTGRVTDAAFDAGRRLLAVRTYTALYLVPLSGPPWRVDHRRRATACDLSVLREPQGEGVAFLPGAPPTLALASETNLLGVGGLATAACPAPG